MNKLITEAPTPQGGFPWEDLTPRNASLLGLWLSNPELFRIGHQAAEAASDVYRLGHQAMLIAARPMAERNYVAAMSRGIAAYEAAASYVRPTMPERDSLSLGRSVANLASVTLNSFLEIAEEAEAGMTDLPNVRSVMHDVADRFAPGLERYVQLGAALACGFETSLGIELGLEPSGS